MPYIPQERRDEIHNQLVGMGQHWTPTNAGDLNWLVSNFVDHMLAENGIRYAHLNEMIGALECCKLELYRRIAAPYEDEVCKKNGDAYYCDKDVGLGDEY